MSRVNLAVAFLVSMCAVSAGGLETYESDVFRTSEGELTITFLGHGSLIFSFAGKTVYVDPYGRVADYSQLPKADLVLITHEHRDHLDLEALGKIRTDSTEVVGTEAVVSQVPRAIVMNNGETRNAAGFHLETVAAYNIVNKRENGQPYHPKGVGNGYIITFGDTRVYVAGDTENIPEMKALHGISIAFLPMNLPYTMTPEMVANAARALHPRVLYPYHFSGADPSRLVELLKDEQGIEVRVRQME